MFYYLAFNLIFMLPKTRNIYLFSEGKSFIKMTTDFFNKGNSKFHSSGDNLNECTHFDLVKHVLQDHITNITGT